MNSAAPRYDTAVSASAEPANWRAKTAATRTIAAAPAMSHQVREDFCGSVCEIPVSVSVAISEPPWFPLVQLHMSRCAGLGMLIPMPQT